MLGNPCVHTGPSGHPVPQRRTWQSGLGTKRGTWKVGVPAHLAADIILARLLHFMRWGRDGGGGGGGGGKVLDKKRWNSEERRRIKSEKKMREERWNKTGM